MDHIDVAIVGGGPAGLAAALYSARALVNTVVFESGLPGGQIVTTDRLENYPGFPEGISGPEIGLLMHQQAEKFGAFFRTFEAVEKLEAVRTDWKVAFDGGEILAHAIIVATGAVPKKLGIPGEDEYTGRGVSWCATCDGALFRDKEVAVIGGGDAAAEEAQFLTRFASKVHLVHRREELRATKCIAEACIGHEKVQTHWNRIPTEVRGEDGRVTSVVLRSTKGEPDEVLPVSGIFEYIGVDPKSEIVRGVADLDERGFIKVDDLSRTSMPGLFAAGDVTDRPLKQVVTAAAQGAIAGYEASRYVESKVCTL
ncbi:MAG TPA: thioredoxin-disulfide reductase [Coriobacteriia bacterium]